MTRVLFLIAQWSSLHAFSPIAVFELYFSDSKRIFFIANKGRIRIRTMLDFESFMPGFSAFSCSIVILRLRLKVVIILSSSCFEVLRFLPELGRLPTMLEDSNDDNIFRTVLTGILKVDGVCMGRNPGYLAALIAERSS